LDHPKYTAAGKGAAARGLKVAVAVQVFEEPAAKAAARRRDTPASGRRRGAPRAARRSSRGIGAA